jgi:hypothetical protein
MALPAGYRWYGGRGGDFAGSGASGEPLIIAGGAVFTVRTQLTAGAGTLVTDLYDASEEAASDVTTDDFGNYLFGAADTYGTLFLHRSGLARGYPVDPVDLADRVVVAEAAVAAAEAAQAAAEAAEAAVAAFEARVDALEAFAVEKANAVVLVNGAGNEPEWWVMRGLPSDPTDEDIPPDTLLIRKN